MLGPGEILLLVLIALVLFGPSIFTRAASSIGEGVNQFKKARDDSEDERERHEMPSAGSQPGGGSR